MKILFVSHGGNREGSPIALLNIIREMLNRKIEVGVTVPSQEGYFYEEVLKSGAKIFYKGQYPTLMKMPNDTGNHWEMFKVYCYKIKQTLAAQLMMYRIIKEFNPDIVHTNTSAIDYALLGCKLTHTPHVWHVRELLKDGCDINVFPSSRIFKWKLRLPFSHNIAITKAIYEHYHMTNKDTIIYDGVINSTYYTESVRSLSFPYFLTVGYINDTKGIKEIIKQYAIFSKGNSETHLVFAGCYWNDDPYCQSCEAIIQNSHLENKIHFLGVRNDVYALMRFAKALIIGSKFEGFGFAMTEAMFNNCLVIGKNVGGIKEQFDIGLKMHGKEIGLRFEQFEELPSLMQIAVSSDNIETKQMARQTVIENYTVKKNVDQIIQFYRRLLA